MRAHATTTAGPVARRCRAVRNRPHNPRHSHNEWRDQRGPFNGQRLINHAGRPNDRTVMVERVDTFSIGGKQFSLETVGVVEVGSDGLFRRWREYYDSKSISDQLEAAGIPIPT